jgi:hypothetical protein
VTSLPLRVTTRAAAYILLFALSIVSVVSGKTMFIIASPFGNLGNRLFLYANVIGFAIEHKAIVVNPASHPWRAIFKGTRGRGLGLLSPASPASPQLGWH